MLKLSRNNQHIKLFGVPPNTLPLVIYIGIFCYWVLLHYNMSFKTIAGGFNGDFWWYGPRSEDRELKKTNLPKLSCGFKSHNQNSWENVDLTQGNSLQTILTGFSCWPDRKWMNFLMSTLAPTMNEGSIWLAWESELSGHKIKQNFVIKLHSCQHVCVKSTNHYVGNY